ncbi:MAG: hypothetical protein NTY65_01455, partial [Planctomycetota bacterium]|nr:hypothetical protein [Planctomycetota bacterium]
MAIYAVCKCGKKFGFKNEAAGRQVKCPACGAMIALPGGAAAPKAEAEPELTFAPDPKTGRSPAAQPPPEVDLAFAMEQAAASARAARPVLASKKAAPTSRVGKKTVLMAVLGVVGVAAIAAVIAILCGVLRNPWASGPAQPADVPVAPAAQRVRPRFAEVRLSPKDYVGQTVQWYGEFPLSAGSRVIYIGAKSSDGRSTYRFIVDYGQSATVPEGHGYVTGKVAGTERITESVSRGGMSRSALTNMPLVKEATFEPAGDLAGGPSPLEIIEAAPAISTAIQPAPAGEPETEAPAVMVA